MRSCTSIEPVVSGEPFRDSITESLRGAKIPCGRHDVILSGGPGYRFADSLTVQHGDQCAAKPITDIAEPITDIGDTNEPGHVPNDDVRDDAAGARRAWILQELAKGQRLKAADVAGHFDCSVKTAQRDLTALKDDGIIEFVSAPRTGFYRLCQPASP